MDACTPARPPWSGLVRIVIVLMWMPSPTIPSNPPSSMPCSHLALMQIRHRHGSAPIQTSDLSRLFDRTSMQLRGGENGDFYEEKGKIVGHTASQGGVLPLYMVYHVGQQAVTDAVRTGGRGVGGENTLPLDSLYELDIASPIAAIPPSSHGTEDWKWIPPPASETLVPDANPFAGPGVGNWQQETVAQPPAPSTHAPPPTGPESKPQSYERENMQKKAETDARSLYTGACESMPHSIAERAPRPNRSFGRTGSFGIARTMSFGKGADMPRHVYPGAKQHDDQSKSGAKHTQGGGTPAFGSASQALMATAGRYVYFTGGSYVILPPLPIPPMSYLDRNECFAQRGVSGWNASKACYRVDKSSSAESWEKVADMHVARAMHGCTSYNGRCVVAGGWNEEFDTIDSVEWHHPSLNVWTELGHLWTPRHMLSLVTLDAQLYAVGGLDHHSTVLDYVERFDASRNCWREDSVLNKARAAMSVCALDGRIIAAAGFMRADDGKNLDCCNDVEAFDPVTKAWSDVCCMHEARAQAPTCVYEGCMWVAGGFGTEYRYLGSVESYDPKTDRWTMRPPLPCPLVSFALAVIPTTRGVSLCAFGGYFYKDDNFKYPSKSVFRYDKSEGQWEYMEGMELPEAYACHQMATV